MVNTVNTIETSAWTGEDSTPATATARAAADFKIERETYKLEKRLCRETGKAIVQYNMIEDGDKVMVCLPGVGTHSELSSRESDRVRRPLHSSGLRSRGRSRLHRQHPCAELRCGIDRNERSLQSADALRPGRPARVSRVGARAQLPQSQPDRIRRPLRASELRPRRRGRLHAQCPHTELR